MAEAKAPKAQKKEQSTKKKAEDKASSLGSPASEKNQKTAVKKAEKAVAEKTATKVKELVEAEGAAETIVEAEKQIETEGAKTDKPLAKAGKRSAKAVAEKEEAKAKEERKASTAEKPKLAQKPPRTKAERAGKKYREVYKLVDPKKSYTLAEAMELAAKTTVTKFDSSVEIHIRLGVDPKIADQNIRGNVVLPAGTGKDLRIAVICEPDDEKAATAAGADAVGAEKVFAMLDKEQLDFDVLVAAPTQMAKLGKYARLLGPRGLMPSPKSGTVSADVAKAVTEAKAGKVEFRVDSSGIVHLAVGKVSFGPEKLVQNAQAVLTTVKAAKPASLKGNYILSIFATTTMGPSIRITG